MDAGFFDVLHDTDDHGAAALWSPLPPSFAEIAVAVADDWQDAGVGSALLRELNDVAVAAGVTHIRAIVRLENRASISLLRRLRGVVTRRVEGPELHVLATTS